MRHKYYSEPIYRMIRAYLSQTGLSYVPDEEKGKIEITLFDDSMRKQGDILFTVGVGCFDCVATIGLELPEIRWNEIASFINHINARLHRGSLRVRYPDRELYYQITCDCGTNTPSTSLIHESIEQPVRFGLQWTSLAHCLTAWWFC